MLRKKGELVERETGLGEAQERREGGGAPRVAGPEASQTSVRSGSDSAGARGALRRIFGRAVFDEIGVLVALLALIALIGAFNPQFLTFDSLVGLVRQSAFITIMAFGMVFLIAMRELDLSVGSIYAVTILGAAILMRDGTDPWLAAALGILIGAVLGATNGLLTNAIRVPAIVVTLGTLSAFRGIASVWSDSEPVVGIPTQHPFFSVFGVDYFGVPMSVWILLLLGVVLTVVFRRTRYGVMVRAIGSNEQASRFSGIPIARTRFLTLVLSGTLCGIAGMLTLAYFGAADPALGQGLELQVIAAAIIGGTSLAGGSGTILGALLGALLIAAINSGLVYFSIPNTWSPVVTGGVIVLAVAVDSFLRRRHLIAKALSSWRRS